MTTQLTVSELFTPAPSGVGPFGQVPAGAAASGSWLAQMLSIAKTVQLPTTSWQPGAPERTIFAVESVTFSQSDVNISVMAQGGFLQSAATGTVTYTTNDGTTVTIPVTPDPSNSAQNPTGALGWEDLLSENVYGVTRLSATFATGPLAIANISGTSKGPYTAGSYHAANPVSGSTYTNVGTLSIPSSAIAGTGGQVAGVSVGFSSTIITTTSAHGLTAGQTVYLLIPQSSGVSGLSGVFALVVAVTTSSLQVQIGSSGTWTSSGTVYLCTVTSMQADVAGVSGNAGPGTVTTAVTQSANVFISNVIGWSGSNWESNQGLLNRCILSLASRSPNGPSQAYIYFADTAVQLLAEQTPAYVLTNGPVTANESSNPQTGIVTTVVASISPASTTLGAPVTPGVAQLPIAGVSNANPCVISCTGSTSLAAGQSMTVAISGVLGTAGVNGTFLGTYVSSTSFSIPINTTSAGTYTGGGVVEGGDLGQIDALLRTNVLPDGQTLVTVSAVAMPITIVATVVVPQAYVAAYQIAVLAQLNAQLGTYPIGGSSETSPANSIPWNDILGALDEAGVIAIGQASYVKQVQSLSITDGVTTATGSGQGVAFPGNTYQAILAVPSVTTLGV